MPGAEHSASPSAAEPAELPASCPPARPQPCLSLVGWRPVACTPRRQSIEAETQSPVMQAAEVRVNTHTTEQLSPCDSTGAFCTKLDACSSPSCLPAQAGTCCTHLHCSCKYRRLIQAVLLDESAQTFSTATYTLIHVRLPEARRYSITCSTQTRAYMESTWQPLRWLCPDPPGHAALVAVHDSPVHAPSCLLPGSLGILWQTYQAQLASWLLSGPAYQALCAAGLKVAVQDAERVRLKADKAQLQTALTS